MLAVFAFVSPATAVEPNKQDTDRLPDYSTWKALTPKPVRVDRAQATACESAARIRPRVKLGPHSTPAVKYYANAEGAKGLEVGPKEAMPVGATIVKEKYDAATDAKPSAYAAMIKREPGYDKENGDWEYLFVELAEKPVVTRGAIKSCIQCHTLAQKKDYLFRTHLAQPVPRTP